MVSSIRRRPDLPSAEVHSITTAPEPLADDLARRQKRYLVQMGIRILCFAGAVLTWGRIPMWASLLLIVAAVVLPYSPCCSPTRAASAATRTATFMAAREIGPGSGRTPAASDPSDRPGGSTA